MNAMRQTTCLVVNPVTVSNFAALFYCIPAGPASDVMMAPAFNFSWGLSDPPGFICWISVAPTFQFWSCC